MLSSLQRWLVAPPPLATGTLLGLLIALGSAWWRQHTGLRALQAMTSSTMTLLRGGGGTISCPPSGCLPGGTNARLAESLEAFVTEYRETITEFALEKTKFQLLFEKSDDAVILIDRTLYVQAMNPAACQLFGRSADTTYGSELLTCTNNPVLSELANRVIATRMPAMLPVSLRQAAQTHLDAYVSPLDAGGSPVGALLLLRDMLTPKHAYQMRRDFVANVSHELRTPLASVRAMAETIALRGQKDRHIIEIYAPKIMAEVDRLTALASDLLDLAQIESGSHLIRRESLCLADLLETLLATFQPLAEHKGITLRGEVPKSMHITADQDALQQIFVNLIDNALKFTPAGGQVLISTTTDADRQIIRITDNGIGIPAADVPRIFERFYRVDKARSRASGGTGLGLAIVKHLVEAHDGLITVASSPAHGSTFTISFPTTAIADIR